MAQIGIIIDSLRGSIPASFRDRITSFLKAFPQVAFIETVEDLTSSEGLGQMARHLEERRPDRVLIIGGSPKLYERSFQKWGPPVAFNPFLMTVANVREQALWVTMDEERAFQKAQGTIAKALRQSMVSQPIEPQSLPLKQSVLVLGGGISGVSVALELAKAGIQVFLIEKGSQLGGRLREVQTFYNRPGEVSKWLEERLSYLKETPNITIFTETELKYLRGQFGNFQAKIRRHGNEEEVLHVSAIVVATGYETERERGGIFDHKRVITLSQMERLLSQAKPPSFQFDGAEVQTVTFLLDQVNEDVKIDSIHAIKQSLQLQASFGCQVVILCKDVKVSADGMERLYRRAREKGVLFIKYEDPPRFSIVNGQIQVDVRDTAPIQKRERWPLSILSDLLVTSEALVPSQENRTLSAILNISVGGRGFLMDDNPQLMRIRSNRRGIFVAGGCRWPQEVSETLNEARAVADEVIVLLSAGQYDYDLAVAEVDPEKCAVCYTCPRLCPHGAITVEHYAQKNIYTIAGREERWGAAKVDPVACYGCGICVAECPARAITLRHLSDEQIFAQMNLP